MKLEKFEYLTNLTDLHHCVRRPKSFLPEQNYGGLMFKQEPFYGYAVIQRPYLVPLSNASVYMSCYGTVTNEPHYYVNGNFLAEKLRYEEDEVGFQTWQVRSPFFLGSETQKWFFGSMLMLQLWKSAFHVSKRSQKFIEFHFSTKICIL